MTIINEHRDPEQVITAEQIEAAITPEQRAERAALQASETTRRTLDQKVRDAVVKGGTLDTTLGTTADVAPALTNAAIKVASLRSLGKLSNADTAANAGPILQRLIALMIDGAQIDKRTGKLTVQLFDDAS